MAKREVNNERGAALLEVAVTLPLILLISVAIFEFGRAYQTWQVMTNAAREGARVAIINGTTKEQIEAAVTKYMSVGGVTGTEDQPIKVDVDRETALGAYTGSTVTVSYPFKFMVLNPVAQLVNRSSTVGTPLTMSAVAVMRNES